MYVPLEVHSCYSMLSGTAWPRQLVARAVEYDLKTLALTDTHGLYGAIDFYTAARAAGIKPILGARLGPCILLARDRQGYSHLCEIITQIRLGELDATQLDQWPFDFDASHLFILCDDMDLLARLRQRGVAPFAAIAHHGGAKSRRYAEALLHAAHALGIRAAATAPVYFLNREDYHTHRILTAIRRNTTETALPPDATASPHAWFRPPEQMERLYGLWPEVLDNTTWIAEECSLELPLGTPLFPKITLEDDETPFSWLWEKTFEGLRRRYKPLTPAVLDRAHHELGIINELGFAPYFLIVADIVTFAQHHDIPVVGRGSAANSIVAYALGITRADPLRHNLYFERFLNRARRDTPDIDLDICWRGRDRVLDYVYERFGHDRVAMICTQNTFQARSAVRETAKALGFTERDIAPITRALPHYGAEDLRLIIDTLPECRNLSPDEEPLKSIIDISEKIAGLPRHLSIHAGGMLIAPERITHYTPLEKAPKGIIITQYDKDPIEHLGLVKMDLLGHRSLSVIHDTVAAVRTTRDPEFDIEAIPDPNPATAALLRTGNTVGCFQIESPAMRGLLRKLDACDCNTVIQAIALVRPGASGSGMKQHFIDRHHGREPVDYLHPTMEQALGDTYGVMIYQEDVLKVAHAVAGMTLDEADTLRRAMSRKRGAREMARNMKRFIEGATANGVPEETACAIWELIANFAAYAYCKAHATTYGELACQCAYLKAHYPAEFFTAVLANGGGFYSTPVYVSEARRCGVPVLPPDVNRSGYNHVQEGDAIRCGLFQIASLTEKTTHELLEARTDKSFDTLDELLERVQIGAGDGEALSQSGALDSLPGAAPMTRPMQAWRLRGNRESCNTPVLLAAAAGIPILPDYSARRKVELEWERLGMLLSTHPLRYHAACCCKNAFIASKHITDYEGRTVAMLGIVIAERRLSLRNGEGCMKFLTLEDVWGVFEAVLFPECYRRYGHLPIPGSALLCSGTVQCEHNAPALIVESIQLGMPSYGKTWKTQPATG